MSKLSRAVAIVSVAAFVVAATPFVVLFTIAEWALDDSTTNDRAKAI